jgi:hypothetical protein
MVQFQLSPNNSLVQMSFYLTERLNDRDEQRQLLHQAKNQKDNQKTKF